MKTCPNCGVEVEENANFCSLCGEPLLEKNEESLVILQNLEIRQQEKLFRNYGELTGKQKRRIFWHISWIILLTGMIVTSFIDLIQNSGITWSKYPLSVSLILFLNISIILFFFKRVLLLLFLSFLSTSLLLIFLDTIAGRSGWGPELGVPLLLAAYMIVFFLISLIRRSKQKGLNIIAYTLLAAGLLSLCVDGIISVNRNDSTFLSWSMIVMTSTIVVSVVLLFIHFRLKKVTDLRRFFHV